MLSRSRVIGTQARAMPVMSPGFKSEPPRESSSANGQAELLLLLPHGRLLYQLKQAGARFGIVGV